MGGPTNLSTAAVFQLAGDMSPSGDSSRLGGEHNTICCYEKIKAFLRSNNVALLEI